MRTLGDLGRMARRELLLALLDLAPPVKRRLMCAVQSGATLPIVAFLKGHRHT